MFVNMAGFTVEYQAVILNDIGVKNLLGLVSPELTLASKLDIASVFDGLLMDSMYTHTHTHIATGSYLTMRVYRTTTDNSKQKIIAQGGYTLIQQLGELGLVSGSLTILRFLARTIAAQANLYSRMFLTTLALSCSLLLSLALSCSLCTFAY
jgi:hypothetical protein